MGGKTTGDGLDDTDRDRPTVKLLTPGSAAHTATPCPEIVSVQSASHTRYLSPSPLPAPLNRQPPENVFQLLYGRCRDSGYIATGALRPNTKGEVATRYWLPISVTEWQPLLPGFLSFRPELTKYFSPNTFNQRALLGKKPSKFVEQLNRTQGQIPLYFEKMDKHVKELTSIWVDLDAYKSPVELDAATCFGIVMAKIARGDIPWPSLVAYSGRGSYYLWLLREPESIAPPLIKGPNDPNSHLWRQVIDETIRRTTDLVSDKSSKALSSWIKMPGTTDHKSGNEVWYMTVGAGMPFNVPIYTLPDLSEHYGLLETLPDGQREIVAPYEKTAPPKKLTPRKPAKRKSTRPRRGGNPGAPYRRRIYEIERIAQHRGGIPEGSRNTTLLWYFYAARAYYGMFLDKPEAHKNAVERVAAFNAKYCRPPMESHAVKWCAPRKRDKWEVKRSILSRHLKVTIKEAEALDLVALAPPTLKARRDKEKKEKQNLLAERRQVVDAALCDGRTAPEIIAAHGKDYDISRAFVWSRARRLDIDPTRQEKLKL